MNLILGSASKGRRSVLERHGYEFDIITADIDEKAIRFEDPDKLTLVLAHAKADAILERGDIKKPSFLITTDQVIAWKNHIIEKPESREEVVANFSKYAEESPETVSAVVVTNTETGERHEGIDRIRVHFNSVPDEAVREIADDPDTRTRAGGFSVEDQRLKDYLSYDGEEESIIGLPLALTKKLLEQAGYYKSNT